MNDDMYHSVSHDLYNFLYNSSNATIHGTPIDNSLCHIQPSDEEPSFQSYPLSDVLDMEKK